VGSLLVAFFAGFVLDLAWAYYTRQVADRRPVRAAMASIATGALGAVGVLSVVSNGWAIPFYCGGLATGTYVAVRWAD